MRKLFVLFAIAAAACAHLSQQDEAELAQYQADQSGCIIAHPGDKAAIDACRAEIKKYWCDQWKSRFDAGVCQ
jgi:hypothetical protein